MPSTFTSSFGPSFAPKMLTVSEAFAVAVPSLAV